MENYYSQYQQDKILRETYFSNVDNGYFIEIGADDGMDKSNTYFFEQIGWTGLCIEPSPSRFKALIKNRHCECINIAISDSEKEVEFLDMTGYGKGLSGIIANYDERHVERIERETKNNPQTLSKNKVVVKTQRLDKLLSDRNIRRVDYCSIDVEGSELEILRSINFKDVFFGIFTIEDPYGNKEVLRLMSENGFILEPDKIGPDLVFRNANFTAR